MARLHRSSHPIDQRSIDRKVREALRQIDGAGLLRQCAHPAENGQAKVGEFGLQWHGEGPSKRIGVIVPLYALNAK
jgi:hypothetical protein